MVLRIIFFTILTQNKEPRMVYARYVVIFGTILLKNTMYEIIGC